MMNEPLFRSAHAALVFALNYSGQAYDRPLMNRMSDEPSRSSGKGLHGLDGAAQAGMILAELSRLAPVHGGILTARIAPRYTPCSCRVACCSKRRPNTEWEVAIDEVSRFAINALSGCVSNGRLRRGIVCRFFGSHVSLGKLAEDCSVSAPTAGSHNARISKLLRGEELRAWESFEARLRETGMVGEAVPA